MTSLDKHKIVARLDGLIVNLLLLTALACCVSEPLSRNLVRAVLVLAIARLLFDSSILTRVTEYKKLFTSMAAMCLMLAASAIYGDNWEQIFANGDFRYNYYMLLVPVMILFMTDISKLRLFAVIMILSLMTANCHVFYQWYIGNPRPTSWIHTSFMMTGMFYCLIVPLIAVFVAKRDETLNMRRLFAVCFVVSCFALILTGTRAALIATALVCPLVFISCTRNLQKTLFFVGIGSFLLAAAVIAMPQTNARFQTAFDMSYQSNSERILVWHSALDMFADRPLLGTGYGNFKQVYDNGYASPNSVEDLKHAHSNYLQFLSETGLIGLAVHLFMLYTILMWLWRRRMSSIYVLAAFFSTLTLALFSFTDYTYIGFSGMRIQWLLLGAAIASERLTRT